MFVMSGIFKCFGIFFVVFLELYGEPVAVTSMLYSIEALTWCIVGKLNHENLTFYPLPFTAACVDMSMCYGLERSFGIFFVAFLETFEESVSVTSLLSGTQAVSRCILGMVSYIGERTCKSCSELVANWLCLHCLFLYWCNFCSEFIAIWV